MAKISTEKKERRLAFGADHGGKQKAAVHQNDKRMGVTMKRNSVFGSVGVLVLMVAALAGLNGCGPNGSDDAPQPAQYATVDVEIGQNIAAGVSQKVFEPTATYNDVTRVVVEIRNGTEVLSTKELAKVSNVWRGSFELLPVGVSLQFRANAYGVGNDGKPLSLFSGQTTQSLVAGSNSVTILLTKDVVPPLNNFPQLTVVQPSEVLVGTTAEMVFTFADSSSNRVTYEVLSGTSPATAFTPQTGVVFLTTGVGSARVQYRAPSTAGTYTYQITAANTGGNGAQHTLSVNVVTQLTNRLDVNFSPVITALQISLTGTSLTFLATVVDDGPANELTYAWSYNGGLTFTNSAANPAVLTGYTTATRGVVRLTVRDARGGTNDLAYSLSGQAFTTPVTLLMGNALFTADLVVDQDKTVASDAYHDTILVLNGATVTFQGSVFARNVVVRNGRMIVAGDLNTVEAVTVEEEAAGGTNTLTVNGDANSAQTVEVFNKSTLTLSGNWQVRDWIQYAGSISQVIVYSPAANGSGTFVLKGDNFRIEAGAVFSANGTGADPRGEGGGYAGSGGAGYGGAGCRGWWSATRPGPAFGDAYSYTIDMGSYGGYYGGGKVLIELTGSANIAGSLTSNGLGGIVDANRGGGSGGGILINAPAISITGAIEAKGGAGDYALGGGGGGGRIKLFYETGISTAVLNLLNVSGGLKGGNPSTCDGAPGTIWLDAIPMPPALSTPANNATVGSQPTFAFSVSDASVTSDSRDDDLTCVVEVSTNGFADVFTTYDQTLDLTGWSNLSYKTGDTVSFTPPQGLPSGTYQWRARVKDKSIAGRYSAQRAFVVP